MRKILFRVFVLANLLSLQRTYIFTTRIQWLLRTTRLSSEGSEMIAPFQARLSPTAEDKPTPFSFSACLLAKDVNIILPEWLAYHYTVLPLRRLIVAVDPMTATDPTPILEMYRSLGVNITIWTNDTDAFWVNGSKPEHTRGYRITNQSSFLQIREKHRHRQKMFYQACLQRLQNEGRSWTAFVDTDEFVAFNYYDEGEKTKLGESDKRSHLGKFHTVAEYIESGIDDMYANSSEKSCVVLSRPLFISKDGDRELIERDVPEGFDPSYFHTLRYRFRQSLQQRQNGKSLVDASRYDGRRAFNAHRVVGDLCTNNRPDGTTMGLRIHHYVGSWEAFRKPGLDLRGWGTFQDRNSPKQNANSEDDTVRPWLSRFVELVGNDVALAVTQSARQRGEAEVRQIVAKLGKGEGSDWSHLDYDTNHPFRQEEGSASYQ